MNLYPVKFFRKDSAANLTGASNPSILLTIDVEDWFQVENFKQYIPFSSWPKCELRVEQNTHHILNLLDSHNAQPFESLKALSKVEGQSAFREPVRQAHGPERHRRTQGPEQSRRAHSTQRKMKNGQRTRPPRLSPPVTARHERAGESNGGQATGNRPENKTSLRQRRIASSQFQEETEKTRKSSESRKSCLTTPKATFFVLGWIAERLPHLVKEIHSRGHEVASHGYRHNLCTDCSSEDLKTDLVESKKRLEDITGSPVYGYRAPSFSINDDILKIIEQCGYLYDSSFNSFGMHGRYGQIQLSQNTQNGIATKISDSFYELPISNLNVRNPFSYACPVKFSKKDSKADLTGVPSAISSEQNKGSFVLPWGGGGYFRLIPFPLFKIGIKFVLGEESAYLFYFHPWEIDPEQPKVNDAPFLINFGIM